VKPINTSPGQAGYDAIVSSIQSNVAGHNFLDPTLMAGEGMRRMVLVNFNGGSVSDPTFLRMSSRRCRPRALCSGS